MLKGNASFFNLVHDLEKFTTVQHQDFGVDTVDPSVALHSRVALCVWFPTAETPSTSSAHQDRTRLPLLVPASLVPRPAFPISQSPVGVADTQTRTHTHTHKNIKLTHPVPPTSLIFVLDHLLFSLSLALSLLIYESS